MAKPAAFTPEQFEAAYKQLKLANPDRTPTVSQLRDVLGGGSNTTIIRSLRDYESRLQGGPIREVEIPSSVLGLLRQELTKLVMAEEAKAQVKLADQSQQITMVLNESQALSAQLEEATNQVQQLREQCASLNSRLEAAEQAAAQAETRHAAQVNELIEEVDRLRESERISISEKATLNLKLENMPKIEAALKSAEQRNQELTESLSTARAELAEARAFQQSAQESYKTSRTDRERDLSALEIAHREIKQLNAELMACRVQVQSQQIALDAAVREQTLVRDMMKQKTPESAGRAKSKHPAPTDENPQT